jgi:hypothetical protein
MIHTDMFTEDAGDDDLERICLAADTNPVHSSAVMFGSTSSSPVIGCRCGRLMLRRVPKLAVSAFTAATD